MRDAASAVAAPSAPTSVANAAATGSARRGVDVVGGRERRRRAQAYGVRAAAVRLAIYRAGTIRNEPRQARDRLPARSTARTTSP
jgi:hypothetical protein